MTCLCLTRNRRAWLPHAIRCYQNQTYPNRKLLILSSGESVGDLVPADDPTISHAHVTGNPPVGEMRNIGVAMIGTDLVAHWDDDDWSAPDRLAHQVPILVDSGRAVAGYQRMLFAAGDGRVWLYRGTNTSLIGSSMVFRRQWAAAHPFKRVQQGEDVLFARHAFARGQAVGCDAECRMWASIHPGNTCPRPPVTPGALVTASWKLTTKPAWVVWPDL